MNRVSLMTLLLGFSCVSLPALANKTNFDCTIEVAKGSCWGKQTVTFDIPIEDSPAQKIVLGKTEFSKKIEFPCGKRKVISFNASIDPPIWTGKENNRPFPSRERWSTPMEVGDNIRSWAIRVCFEKDFFNAPRPISDDQKCDCTFPKDKGG